MGGACSSAILHSSLGGRPRELGLDNSCPAQGVFLVMTEPRLEHQNIKIKQLIDDYRMGRIVIPEFQREYVWKKSKAPKLIDSLYRGFPISSLLLWQSSEETSAARR